MAAGTRFCTQCGDALEESDRYCGSCGSPVRPRESAPPTGTNHPRTPPLAQNAPVEVKDKTEGIGETRPSGAKSQWERIFGEGGAAERNVAEINAQHEATFGPSRRTPTATSPTLQAASVQPGARTNGMAVASLVLALLGFGIGSILAVIFGYQAQREIDASGGMQTGRGLATAGIVIGWISLVLWAFILLAVIANQ